MLILRNCWVDVRDLAYSLVLAVKTPAASGQRFIISHGPFTWEDFGEHGHGVHFVESANSQTRFVALTASKITNKAQAPPSYDPAQVTHKVVYNGRKAKEVLGITYHTLDGTVADLIEDWKTRGWL